MKWFFADNNGGQESGLNDAGIETFKGDSYYYLARELIQNSIDARLDKNKPVIVQFQKEEISKSEISGIGSLDNIIKECEEYWPKEKKARIFFERARGLLKKMAVSALRIRDYNTTGISGKDNERNSHWYKLIRCTGSSSKDGGEGGSFGIGKNAPFAASLLRTILYSTMTRDKGVAFQGVAKLVTREHKKKKMQATGYLGDDKGLAIRDARHIPKRFRRSQSGTDIIILGFSDDKDWKEELVFSVLENFWPAIYFNDLEVRVGEIVISKETLNNLLNDYAEEKDFTAHFYFKTYVDPSAKKFPKKLPILGETEFYLLEGKELPRRVAMIRDTGMVIFHKKYLRSPIPFCGVFICRDKEGNKVLRDMETPRHDEWDPDHPEPGQNKETEKVFMDFIKECIKTLTQVDISKASSIPGLGRLLPDDEDSPEPEFDESPEGEQGPAGEHGQESTEQPKVQPLIGRKINPKRSSLRPSATASGNGDEVTEQASEEEPAYPGTGEEGGARPVPKRGKEAEEGGPGGKGGREPIQISFRAFATNLASGVYTAVLTSAEKEVESAILRIKAVGDDGIKTTVSISQASILGGKALAVTNNAIGPIALLPGRPVKLEFILKEPHRISIEGEAHEVD